MTFLRSLRELGGDILDSIVLGALYVIAGIAGLLAFGLVALCAISGVGLVYLVLSGIGNFLKAPIGFKDGGDSLWEWLLGITFIVSMFLAWGSFTIYEKAEAAAQKRNSWKRWSK